MSEDAPTIETLLADSPHDHALITCGRRNNARAIHVPLADDPTQPRCTAHDQNGRGWRRIDPDAAARFRLCRRCAGTADSPVGTPQETPLAHRLEHELDAEDVGGASG